MGCCCYGNGGAIAKIGGYQKHCVIEIILDHMYFLHQHIFITGHGISLYLLIQYISQG
jgi:hypothetical protein